tara:strand:+ start:1530 stop:1961 length:432 start_codon:yes stop_codon:yes gene_type:complete
MSNLKEIIRKKLKEMSATNQGGASFSAGSGETYATPFAFSKTTKPPKYYYKLGYKPVPNKIKGSSLQVKQLWEEEKEKTDVKKFQEARLNEFDEIQNELNSLISNAKNQTIEYYTSNPGQFSIYKPTSMALEYIKKAKELLSK